MVTLLRVHRRRVHDDCGQVVEQGHWHVPVETDGGYSHPSISVIITRVSLRNFILDRDKITDLQHHALGELSPNLEICFGEFTALKKLTLDAQVYAAISAISNDLVATPRLIPSCPSQRLVHLLIGGTLFFSGTPRLGVTLIENIFQIHWKSVGS